MICIEFIFSGRSLNLKQVKIVKKKLIAAIAMVRLIRNNFYIFRCFTFAFVVVVIEFFVIERCQCDSVHQERTDGDGIETCVRLKCVSFTRRQGLIETTTDNYPTYPIIIVQVVHQSGNSIITLGILL